MTASFELQRWSSALYGLGGPHCGVSVSRICYYFSYAGTHLRNILPQMGVIFYSELSDNC